MAYHSTFFKKAAVAALVSLSLGAGMIASASDAEARYGRKGLVAAGVLGALAVGALVASSSRSHAGPRYHQPQPVYQQHHSYYQPAPVYYSAPRRVYHHAPAYYDPGPGYVYSAPVCRIQSQRVWLSEDTYTIRKVRVCH
jgi:hypothetical protein